MAKRNSPQTTKLDVLNLEQRDLLSINFPVDSNVVDVAAVYGAIPNDGLDDTAAVQQAINDYVARDTILFFRDGVYNFSAPLDYSKAQRGERNIWLQGQSQAGTLFRWNDNLPVFNGTDEVPALDLYNGNNGNAFGNYISDFSVEIGANNPKAIGVQFHSNNYGSVRNITIRTLDPDRRGIRGMDLAFNEPGPWLMENLTIEGFDYGIISGPQTYSGVFEGLTLKNQRVGGFANYRLPVSIHNFTSINTVPAYIHLSGFGWGNTVITDANFSGGDSKTFAVVNENANANGQFSGGNITIRNLTTSGYAGAIDDQVAARQLTATLVPEYTTQGVISLDPASPKTTLNLPIEQTPPVTDDPVENWASVIAFGANPWDTNDDSEAIQKALDSGAKTIYFPTPIRRTASGGFERGSYRIGQTLVVGGNVERIAGLDSSLTVTAPLYAQDAALFRIVDGNRSRVQIDSFNIGNDGGNASGNWYAFQQDTTATLVIKNGAGPGYRNTVRGGKLFVDDWSGSDFRLSGQQAWLRQFNPEETTQRAMIVNDGGDLWILGLKTEGRSRIIDTLNGGRTEVLGGNLYTGGYIPSDLPAFTTQDSSLSFSIAETSFTFGSIFNTLVRDTRNGLTREITRQNTTIDGSRLGAANVGLYTDRIVDATAPSAPTAVQATSTQTRVTLGWTAATDAESRVRAYRVFRDGKFIGSTTATTFTDTARRDGTSATYTVQAENSTGLRSTLTDPLTVSTASDTTAPALLLASSNSTNSVSLQFSEPIAAAAATVTANYSIDNGVTVVSATLSSDGRVVNLTTSALANGVDYTIAVQNLLDRATIPNRIATGSAAAFSRQAPVAELPRTIVRTSFGRGADSSYQIIDGGVTAEYFANNNLSGSPVLTRTEGSIENFFGLGGPGGAVPNDNFSVRYTGFVLPGVTEDFIFTAIADDRVRLWIDDQLIINRNFYTANETDSTPIRLTKGVPAKIRMEVEEDFGGASAYLLWRSPNTLKSIPSYLRPDYQDSGANTTLATYNRLNFSFFSEMIGLRFDLAGLDLANNRIIDSALFTTIAGGTGDVLNIQSVAGVNDSVPNAEWAETGPNRLRWANFPGNAGGNFAFASPNDSTFLGQFFLDNSGYQLNIAGRDGGQFRSPQLTQFLQADTDQLVSVILKRQFADFFGGTNFFTKEEGDGSLAPALQLRLAPKITAAPTTIDLLDAFDTGDSNIDNRTSRNNAMPSSALRFTVNGTLPGALVTLFVDNVEIGSAISTGTSTTILTNGIASLAEGTRSITARQTYFGVASLDSAVFELTVDSIAPTVTLGEVSPDPRTTPVVSLPINFSEPVSGVDVGDFELTLNGVNVDLSAATLSGTGASYSLDGLTIPTTAVGLYSLTLRSTSNGISDTSGNALGAGTTEFWTTVSQAAPRVSSVRRLDPNPTRSSTIRYAVTFTKPVTGVDATDFTLKRGGTITDASVQSVAGSADSYVVTVNSGLGSGSLRLDVGDDDTILDTFGNKLGGTGLNNGSYRSGEIYTIDRIAPRIVSISSVSPNPRRTPVDSLTITFSETMDATSIDRNDLQLTLNGGPNRIGAGVTIVQTGLRTFRVDGLTNLTAASGLYQFTVNGAGTTDLAGNPASNIIVRSWTRETPRVLRIDRTTPQLTNAAQVTYRVTVSESVTSLDASDFRLTASRELTTPSVLSVVAESASTYLVTVSTGTGSGTLRLDFLAPDSGVVDAFGNLVVASFTTGQWYSLDRTGPAIRSITGVSSSTTAAVNSLIVTFTEAIDRSSFSLANLSLKRNGTTLNLSGVTLCFISPTQVVNTGLTALTGPLGNYELAVDMSSVRDELGNFGSGLRTLNWTRRA
jgi:PA14 domain/Pectate lyase superfamily protein/Bacterial Ig-like domain